MYVHSISVVRSAVVSGLTVLLAACGGGGGDAPATGTSKPADAVQTLVCPAPAQYYNTNSVSDPLDETGQRVRVGALTFRIPASDAAVAEICVVQSFAAGAPPTPAEVVALLKPGEMVDSVVLASGAFSQLQDKSITIRQNYITTVAEATTSANGFSIWAITKSSTGVWIRTKQTTIRTVLQSPQLPSNVGVTFSAAVSEPGYYLVAAN
jgi:hypothetical protein